MIKTAMQFISFAALLFLACSCQNGYVEHVGATRLVILQPVPMIDGRFDENFRAILQLLYPHECHDTAFIQDQVFLERIDLEKPARKEFSIPPSLLRDFFGSNNPGKKLAMREEIFYGGDTCFERNPGEQFLAASATGPVEHSRLIGEYVAKNKRNSLVYLFSEDTLVNSYLLRGREQAVYHDPSRLNCRIVSDLREFPANVLAGLTVILLVIPPEPYDSIIQPEARAAVAPPPAPRKAKGGAVNRGTSACPPDSVTERINRERRAVITEFRNLLYYIATSTDTELKRKYREDARAGIYRIKDATVEGIPGNDLDGFLNSGFSRNVVVDATYDRCGQIKGIHIGGR